ncbi:hypothetical protein CRUP_003849 [Coryphaenoides rupestris]|nr:hypothetical protein CRUP_003849 [Coryphaenoides rupestris]
MLEKQKFPQDYFPEQPPRPPINPHPYHPPPIPSGVSMLDLDTAVHHCHTGGVEGGGVERWMMGGGGGGGGGISILAAECQAACVTHSSATFTALSSYLPACLSD